MGNCLFQYASARALHELLGFELVIRKEPDMLKRTFPDAGPRAALRRPEGWQPEGKGEDVLLVRHNHIDVFAMAENRLEREIVIDAYGQDARYFKHFLSAARRWFASAGDGPTMAGGKPLTKEDLVVHVRGGDISAGNIKDMAAGRGPGLAPLPAWYWDGMLRERAEAAARGGGAAQQGRVVVVTEAGDVNSATVKHLVTNHGAAVVSGSAQHDFAALAKADRVALSCSTFSWWAAALSQKKEAHMPVLGLCDPKFPIQNRGPESIWFDAGIKGWVFHDAFAMKERPEGLSRQY